LIQVIQKIHKKILKSFLKKTTRVFYPFCFDDAKKMILSDIGAFNADYRWEAETKEQMIQFRRWIKQDALVLDFGIGVGRVSKEILKEFPQVKVTGVDESKRMLAYCKKYIPKEYRARLRLFHFNKMHRIKDNSVDFAFSLHVLQHVEASKFQKSVQELHRVIKPGGFLYLLNMHNRCTFDNYRTHITGYDDGIDQLKVIRQYFKEKEDIAYTSDYMKEILKTCFSKLFFKSAPVAHKDTCLPAGREQQFP
jgi:ubiquinone/menaquinone biosynthesis C-methylase UbiE